MKNITRILAAGVLTLCLTAAAFAADVAGKWTWKTRFGQNGTEVEQTLELKLEGEKVTGTVTGRNNTKTEIKDGTFKNNEVAFNVIRERDGNQFKIAYKGKLEGDTIKGTTTTNFNGNDRSREWVANRVK